jgi:GT2 family glycosyltransferase
MNIYALICTRDAKKPKTTLVETCKFLKEVGAEIKILAEQSSIFEAYSKGVESFDASPDDVIIMCHDDLEFKLTSEQLRQRLEEYFEEKEDTGFVGPAGTTFLTQNAVWWDQNTWRLGAHRGKVAHINEKGETYDTNYGPFGQVVVLDGLFLASKKRVLDEIGLDKPEYFEGEWDFYDIHYTSQAHKAGFKNYAVDIPIIHHSRGELVGRESWHKNREAFIRKNSLPLMLSL